MSGPRDLVDLQVEVAELREALLKAEDVRADEIEAAHPSHRRSAVNLVHYVELRHHDVRELQTRLASLGLSSLGRSEPYVLATIEAVLGLLAGLTGHVAPLPRAGIALGEGNEILAGNADQLLGPVPTGRSTRVMVTFPSEAADDAHLVAGLVTNGMDLARVNCSHDDTGAWARMIAHLRASTGADGRRCLVAMDLGGPKLRTGPLQPGPRVVKVSPRRDNCGQVLVAARVFLSTSGESGVVRDGEEPMFELPVADPAWLERRRRGDRVEFRDSRGSKRRWEVVDVVAGGCVATTEKTAYLVTGLELVCRGADGDDRVMVGELPAVEQAHRVLRGDRVILTRSLDPAAPSRGGQAHFIGCSLAEVFQRAQPGERVWLDDGKFGGTIDHVTDDEIALTVIDVRPGGANLKGGKGINLPDTDLDLDALTPKDLEDLAFVARHADVVNLSFVRRPEDVAKLQDELDQLGARDVGIVLKIENVAAFENLPELLLTAMRSERIGVMIARGDLAVEVGFDRLAEVQEEIMWACEAAHVPVIWATQVLDTLARTGQASRAEVTDAAMANRAECVMLNKGPYIAEAISVLVSILTRMQNHQDKKRSLLRRLRAWDRPGQPPLTDAEASSAR